MAPLPERTRRGLGLGIALGLALACEAAPQVASRDAPPLAVLAAAPAKEKRAKPQAKQKAKERDPAKNRNRNKDKDKSPREREPVPANCPPQSPLTYRSFGAGFLRTWCTGCHSSTLPEVERQGAPGGVDFDRPEHLAALAPAIRERALLEVDAFLADPEGSAAPMPPAGLVPADDRRRLAEWLACGAPGAVP